MSSSKVILIGGGGHCKACIDIIEQLPAFQIAGILDVAAKVGSMLCGYPVLGTDDDILKYHEEGYVFVITLGQIKSAIPRRKIFERLLAINALLPVVIAPSARVSRRSRIGAGTVVMHNVVVNTDAEIGSNCILNTAAIIEHDALLGNHIHVSTRAVVNGTCVVEDECFIGSGAVLVNNIRVMQGVVIGAGTLVNVNIEEPGTYVGNPARKIK